MVISTTGKTGYYFRFKSMINELLIKLHQQPATVFTLKDIALLSPGTAYNNLKAQLSYIAKTGKLKKLSRGVYAKENYNVLELANKLYAPSYISLETILKSAGAVFQYYAGVFAVSYLTRTVAIDGKTIEYRRIRKDILLDKSGLEDKQGVTMAVPERAFLDAVYIYKNYHFDNLGALDWDKVMMLKTLYKSSVLNKRVEEYYRTFKEDNA